MLAAFRPGQIAEMSAFSLAFGFASPVDTTY